MKKIFFIAAACLALFSCNDKPTQVVVPDAIEVTPRTVTFGAEGGAADVIITSTGEWTLSSTTDYDWVSPSELTGEDGDIITFTVDPNTDADKNASFTFVSGEASATFTVFSYAGEAPALELVSDETVEFSYEADQLEICVATTTTFYRDVEFTLSEGAEEWLEYQATLPGETENDAKLYFNVAALEGLADREAVVTVSAPGLAPVEVEVAQFAKHVLSTPTANYTIPVAGGTIYVPLTANVEYSISMEGASGWLTSGTATAEGIPFTATALADGKRTAVVTFTQTDAVAGETALQCKINITQVNALITWAADMTGNRLFPKWDNGGPGTVTDFTLETLIFVNEFPENQVIATVMGIEGSFLLRFGDSGVPLNNLQVATSSGNYRLVYDFEALRWYHIALVATLPDVKIYVDGELKGEYTFSYQPYPSWYPDYWVTLGSVNISPAWSYEPSGNRAFWMGYSYDQNRSLPGYMTEIRLWNKALTAEEINAENHFYTVDPNSEGLFSYWKFEAGEGATIADATGKGNPLYGETDVRKQGSDNIGDSGIEWVEVALPDK